MSYLLFLWFGEHGTDTLGVVLCCRIEYNSAVSRELTKLMKIPVDNYNNLLTVLQLQHYAPLLDTFDYHGRKNLAAYIVTNALDNETLIPTQEQVRYLCSSSLIVDCHCAIFFGCLHFNLLGAVVGK